MIKPTSLSHPLATLPDLRVVASPNPFSDYVADLELPAGGTILDLMRAAGCDRALIGHAHVHIIDRPMTQEPIMIPRENWARVRPKPGMHAAIRVVAAPRGGGGGGKKNPLRTILTIAVVVASYGVASWAAGAYAGWAGVAADSFAAQLVGGLASAATCPCGPVVVNAALPEMPA